MEPERPIPQWLLFLHQGAAFVDLSPHPFAVVDAAYRLMINDGINQSILLIHKNPARNQLSACLNKAMHQDRGRSSYSGAKK